MLEAVANASKALGDWPGWNAAFLVGVVFVGMFLRHLGVKDKKAGYVGTDMPLYIMAHDATKAIAVIEEECRKTNTNLADIAREINAFNRGQNLTHELLQDIRNNQQIRDTMAPHKSPGRV